MSENMYNKITLLYNGHKDALFTLARRYLLNNDCAIDAVQDVFVKLFENKNKISDQMLTLSYLYKMTINGCIDLLRKRKKLTLLPDSIHASDTSQKDIENRDMVDYLLASLNPEQRLTVVLSDILELSTNEVAHITEENEGAVRTRLSRARSAMKDAADKKGVVL